MSPARAENPQAVPHASRPSGTHDGAVFNDTPEPVLGLPVDRADSLLPSELLQVDEAIILLLKPSPLYIILGCVGTLGTIVLITLIMLEAQRLFDFGGYTEQSLYTLMAVLGTVRIGWQLLEWLSRTYVLTTRRIIRIRGVIRVEIFQTELRNLRHTEVLFSLRERLFGLGTISIATAGSAFPEAYWIFLKRPMAVHRRIMQAASKCR
ncbi:MAG: PH domain-containing protein [Planctomycetota bacterium]|jgi:uncharacterized membrane protein YdbT with pleckstrin-like domain